MDKDNKKEDKRKYTLKVVITSVISTLLIIAIILLIILFGLKNCSSSNNTGSSNAPIDQERNNKITDVFKKIINNQLEADGYENDKLTDIVSIIYKDNYPTSFTMYLTASSDHYVYYYYADNVSYPSEHNYDNFISYLLNQDSSILLNGDITINKLDLINESINTNKTNYRYIISKAINDEKYLSGFYYQDDSFYVYQKHLLIVDADPFIGVGDQKISSNDILYDYYRGMLL